MSNKFCRFLSNGCSVTLEQDGNLVTSPCCWYQGNSILIDQNIIANREREFNSIADWTPGCQVCQQQELAGHKSFRQSSFEVISDIDNNLPVALDINVDLTCNAACVTCGPHASTTWSKQMTNRKIIHVGTNLNYKIQLEQLFDNIDLSSVQRIKFFGGEPLLTNTHFDILNKLPDPGKVDIWYTTNASIMPTSNVLDLWSKFHLVFFEASIDGIGEQFDYIRWPLKWKLIEKNLLELRETAPVNTLFRINHTLNPFNIFYYDRLEEWVNENFATNRLGDLTEINLHPCWGEWALARTPTKLREKVYIKYGEHNVSKLLATSDNQPYNTIIQFTDTWDSIRKNNWKETFPEIIEYFI
jgi:sulfatase maturation enzyme AslB (radical SAM superfamily)